MRYLPIILLALPVHLFVLARAMLWVAPRLAWAWLAGQGLWPQGESGSGGREWTLLLSFIEWDGAWQRPQHLAEGLARRGKKVVYCAPVRAHRVLARSMGGMAAGRRTTSQGVTVLSPLVLPFERRLPFFHALNDLIVTYAMRQEIARRAGPPTVLLSNAPGFERPFLWTPAGVRVYDAMDELTAGLPRRIAHAEARMAAGADALTAGTLSVARRKGQHWHKDVRYIGCGVDVDRFSRADAPIPGEIANLPGPILGFFGALNERIDEDILATLARRMPTASVVLIGPLYRRFPALERLGNVHFLGLKPYARLPAYLAHFDVALVPYRLEDGGAYVQPVKVLEYLAGGKPVVSTAIADVAELYSRVVHVARDPEDFARAVRDALAEGGARKEQYRAAAAGRTWDDMIDAFDTAIASAARAGAPGVAHLLHGAHLGGAEEVVTNLCAAHDPGRFRASVILLGPGPLVSQRLERRGVRCLVEPMRGRFDLGAALRLATGLRQVDARIVHTHSGRTNLVGRLAARWLGLRVVSTIHTAVARDINDLGRSNRINALVDRLTRRWSDRIATVSEHNRRELLAGGESPDRLVHVPNGVDLAALEPPPQALAQLRESLGLKGDEPIVGMVASMRPRKGPEVLIQAFREVLRAMPRARLLMIGSAEFVESRDYLADLRELARREGVAERVVFTGHRDDAVDLMWIMDVCVLPSLYGEGLPLAVLEAMARERPVVASRTEGNEEAVAHGETGLLTRAGDARALGEAIAMLLLDRDRARAMGRAGRRRAEELYGVDAMARRYEAIYEELLRRH